MACCKQGGNAFFLSRFREVNAGLLLAQADVAQDKMHFLAFEDFQRLFEIIDRRDDLVTRIAEHIFVVERGQRLILDDEDPLDDLLALPEQHPNSQ